MVIFSAGLNDADQSHNYTDNCYHNTNDTQKHFNHQIMYLSLYFPSVSPPRYWKSSKRKSPLPSGSKESSKRKTFWRKANRYPFEITLIFVSYTKARTEYTKLEEKTNKIQSIYTDKRT